MRLMFLPLFLLISCSSSTMKEPRVERSPSSIFSNQLGTADGRLAFLKGMQEYIKKVEEVMKKDQQSSSYKEWFNLCHKKLSPKFTVFEALSCHDEFASLYFIDINHLDIFNSLEKSDQNALVNNFTLYPSLVVDYYQKRLKQYESKE